MIHQPQEDQRSDWGMLRAGRQSSVSLGKVVQRGRAMLENQIVLKEEGTWIECHPYVPQDALKADRMHLAAVTGAVQVTRWGKKR